MTTELFKTTYTVNVLGCKYIIGIIIIMYFTNDGRGIHYIEFTPV